MFARVNSINDTNYGAKEGEEIEHHLYDNERQGLKRFFDLEDIKYIFKDFDIQYVNEEIMTRYNRGDIKYAKKTESEVFMDNIDIKTPDDILKYMDSIKYGYLDFNKEEHVGTLKGFRKTYQTMSLEETLNHKLGTCIEQVYLMHILLDKIGLKNKMFCTRVYENGDVDDEEDEHMHCFVLYYDNEGVHQIEHPNWERIGIYHFKDEKEAIEKINDIYIKMSGGVNRPVTEFFEVKPKEFNDYINSLDDKRKVK